ncbi:hypothetical protein [Tabrizicola sp.]|jgi:predicted flap endonuclease-1-like 5' DNA nuclease|uniref:hypothetical protein n=1 Tax=Tabrizicola sp. TaxID=2005166 RepID=UPI0025F94571|nr:hypothetical protein [Tabrizicola sp.]MBY0351833.1 hypothetical protein [Tabrizicola sp.]MDK2774056.1 hypothetical protein [Tabrizicola sp.]
MRKAENVNAPWLGGWMIGAAAGLVAFAALTIIGEFDLTPAVVIGAVVAVLAGLILGMPWGAGDGAGDRVRFARAVSPPAAADASRPAEPKPEPVAAAVVSAPRSDASKPAAKPGTKAKPKPKLAKPAGPVRLTAPRNGKADDLKEIEGIGPAMEKLLNSLGFYHFDQIATWSDADVALVDAEMKTFKGRITRDKWVSQARIIVTEGLEAFRERAKTNTY